MSAEPAVLLLGRRDEPTDGVLDYCQMLREAAVRHGLSFELARVDWAEKGWRNAIVELREKASEWRNRWVLLQFTTLAWSRRGFPLRAPSLLRVLRQCGARPGVVFHDFAPLTGQGIVGNVREFSQTQALHQLYALSELCILTVPLNRAEWLPFRRDKSVFIPVGSNFPIENCTIQDQSQPCTGVPTIAIFGITDGNRGDVEVENMAYAVRFASAKRLPLRLAAIGRGCEMFEGKLRQALAGSGIELSVLGLMSPADLSRVLATATVLLCVRGPVSSRRGSVIAGIVRGLPIVGYRGDETGFPITEAGVLLVEQNDLKGLAQALAQVLTDETVYRDLRQRSREAALKYFSWDAIASQFAAAISAR